MNKPMTREEFSKRMLQSELIDDGFEEMECIKTMKEAIESILLSFELDEEALDITAGEDVKVYGNDLRGNGYPFDNTPSSDSKNVSENPEKEEVYTIKEIEEAVYVKYPDPLIVGVFFKSLVKQLKANKNPKERIIADVKRAEKEYENRKEGK